MRVFLIRHGKAKPDSPTGLDDDRALRPRGHRQAAYLAGFLAARTDRPGLIVVSGLVRAVQTAEPIAAAVGCPTETDRTLGRFFDPEPPADAVRRHARLPSLAIVGHNEQLSMALSDWTGGAERLGTGEMAVLEIKPAAAKARDTLLTAELCARIRLSESDAL